MTSAQQFRGARTREKSLRVATALMGAAALIASSMSVVAAGEEANAAPVGAAQLADETPAVPGNLLPDGRFVADSSGWTNTRGGTLQLSADAASGAFSLLTTARENTQSGPFASVTGKIELGASYRMTGMLKYTEGADTQQFNFTFCPANFNGCADYGHAFTKGE